MEHKKLYGHYFKIISTALETNRDKDMLKLGITVQQMKFLFFIMFSKTPVNQRDIEKEFSLKNSTVSGIILRLEKKSLIRRTVSLSDSRKKIIGVTPEALQLRNKMCKQIDRMEDLLTKDFTEEEKVLLSSFLERIANNLSIEDKERMK